MGTTIVFLNGHMCVDSQNISMASNEVNVGNSNMSGSDDTYADTNVMLNPTVLLVRVEHIDGRPIEPEILTEAAFKDLCNYTNSSHTAHAVEILSPHEICDLQTRDNFGSCSW